MNSNTKSPWSGLPIITRNHVQLWHHSVFKRGQRSKANTVSLTVYHFTHIVYHCISTFISLYWYLNRPLYFWIYTNLLIITQNIMYKSNHTFELYSSLYYCNIALYFWMNVSHHSVYNPHIYAQHFIHSIRPSYFPFISISSTFILIFGDSPSQVCTILTQHFWTCIKLFHLSTTICTQQFILSSISVTLNTMFPRIDQTSTIS